MTVQKETVSKRLDAMWRSFRRRFTRENIHTGSEVATIGLFLVVLSAVFYQPLYQNFWAPKYPQVIFQFTIFDNYRLSNITSTSCTLISEIDTQGRVEGQVALTLNQSNTTGAPNDSVTGFIGYVQYGSTGSIIQEQSNILTQRSIGNGTYQISTFFFPLRVGNPPLFTAVISVQYYSSLVHQVGQCHL